MFSDLFSACIPNENQHQPASGHICQFAADLKSQFFFFIFCAKRQTFHHIRPASTAQLQGYRIPLTVLKQDPVSTFLAKYPALCSDHGTVQHLLSVYVYLHHLILTEIMKLLLICFPQNGILFSICGHKPQLFMLLYKCFCIGDPYCKTALLCPCCLRISGLHIRSGKAHRLLHRKLLPCRICKKKT